MITEIAIGAAALLLLRGKSGGSSSGTSSGTTPNIRPQSAITGGSPGSSPGSASRFVGGGTVSDRGGNDRGAGATGRSTAPSTASASGSGSKLAGGVLGFLGDIVGIVSPPAGRAIAAGRNAYGAVQRAASDANAEGIAAGMQAASLAGGSFGYASPSNAELASMYGFGESSAPSAPTDFSLDAISTMDFGSLGGGNDAGGGAGPNDGGVGPQ